MAKQLKVLLGIDSPLFDRELASIERATGRQGIDIRLIADILESAHTALRAIGLDPNDTTAEELYYALGAHENDPELFVQTPYVGFVTDGHVISFNYGDIITNRQRQFEKRSLDGMRDYLVEELATRYHQVPGADPKHINVALETAGVKRNPVTKQAPKKSTAPLGSPTALMIGDIFTDAFIKLNEKTTKIIKEKDGVQWLALPFGQKPPYDEVQEVRSVGPSPNAAVSAARLGLNVSLMAWIGNDKVGKEAIEHLQHEGVGTEPMVTENNKLTSYWYVLRYGADRTMLVKSEKYDYKWHDPMHEPDWIYLSYIGENSWPLHEALEKYLVAHPLVKFALQPGTFHFSWGTKKMAKLYKRAEIVVMNREEAVDVTKKSYDDLRALSDALHALGPKIVVITDGPNGSYASYDGKLVTIPNYPDPAKPYDRTGAGDAFASTIVSALALGKTMEEALTMAPINSMSVVQKLGAQAGLLTEKEVHNYYLKAPKNYKVTEVKKK